MNVTVNTDASFSNTHKVGTYAFWIVCNLGRITGAGALRKKCNDSTEAEMKAIMNAMAIIIADQALMLHAKVIHINTDSMNAIHVFTQQQKKINKYGLRRYDHLYHKFLTLKATLSGKEIFFAHVKAHVDIDSKRSYVNDWLDKAAKAEMGKIIDNKFKIKTI